MNERRTFIWSDREIEALRDLYTNGHYTKTIAEKIGRSSVAVSAMVRRLGLTRSETVRFHWSVEATERLGQLYFTNLTLRQIAKEIGAPNSMAVINKAKHIGLPPRRIAPPRIHLELSNSHFRIPPETIADRARREAAPHRDLSAAFFGDPPIGYSALERRA